MAISLRRPAAGAGARLLACHHAFPGGARGPGDRRRLQHGLSRGAASLRRAPEFAGLPFVGMEPAVKPAAEATRSGVVGVLATPATFQGELYASVVERFAQGVTVLQQVCPGLVQQIEAGRVDTPRNRGHAARLAPADAGSGHRRAGAGLHALPVRHPAPRAHLRPRRAGDRPGPGRGAPGGARVRTGAALRANAARPAIWTYFTSGPPPTFEAALAQLGIERGPVTPVNWRNLEILPM